MKIEFDLSDKAVRMVKALQVLSGQASEDISEFISQMIEKGLKERIADEIGIDLNDQTPMIAASAPAPRKKAAAQAYHDEDDVTEISDGLGDEDDSDFPENDSDEEEYDEENEIVRGLKDAEGLIPSSGGLSETAIAQDMALSDPRREAKVDSPLWQKSAEEQASADQNPEETFSQMALNMPFPAESDEEDPRAAKRGFKNPRARRANVQGFTGSNAVEAGL